MADILTQQQAKDIARLRMKKHRDADARMLLEGERLVADALRAGRPPELVIIEERRLEREETLVAHCAAQGVEVLRCTARLMQKITDTRQPQGIAAVVALPSTDRDAALAAAGPALPLFALHDIADPGNLGTILRTTEWFGGVSVLLSADSVEPFNPKVVRASMGSVLRLHIGVYEDDSWLKNAARLAGRPLTVTVAEGGDPPEALAQRSGVEDTLRGNPAYGDPASGTPAGGDPAPLVVLGSEAHGLPEHLLTAASRRITIPGSGAESLNVAIAHAILSYAWRG